MVSVIFVEIFSARRLFPLKELKNQVESAQRKYSKETALFTMGWSFHGHFQFSGCYTTMWIQLDGQQLQGPSKLCLNRYSSHEKTKIQ